jgi:hypothetical protein
VLRNGKRVDRKSVKGTVESSGHPEPSSSSSTGIKGGLTSSQRHSLRDGGRRRRRRRLAESIPPVSLSPTREGGDIDIDGPMRLRTGKAIHYQDIPSLSLISATNVLPVGNEDDEGSWGISSSRGELGGGGGM